MYCDGRYTRTPLLIDPLVHIPQTSVDSLQASILRSTARCMSESPCSHGHGSIPSSSDGSVNGGGDIRLDSRKAAFRMHQSYCTSTMHHKEAAADVMTPSRLVHPSNQRASTPEPDRGTASLLLLLHLALANPHPTSCQPQSSAMGQQNPSRGSASAPGGYEDPATQPHANGALVGNWKDSSMS
jgi:hypothetical protein